MQRVAVGVISVALGALGVFAPWRFPNMDDRVLDILLWVSFAALLFGAFVLLREIFRPSTMIPIGRVNINRAAHIMYDHANEALRDMARTVADLGAEDTLITAYFEQALLICARRKLVTLYGRRQPGLGIEEIPIEELNGVHCNQENQFTDFHDSKKVRWYDVQVPRGHIANALRYYRDDVERQRLKD